MSPPREKKAGNALVWVVSCIFFLAIVAGIVCLGIYISQPESDSTYWFLATGMTLVGIPWVFWFLTVIYRCLTPRGDARGPQGVAALSPVIAPAAIVPVTADNVIESPSVEDSHNDRHVRFGGATVMGGNGGGEEGCSGDGVVVVEEEEDSGGTITSRASLNDDSSSKDSSHTSHESELPLTFGMSS